MPVTARKLQSLASFLSKSKNSSRVCPGSCLAVAKRWHVKTSLGALEKRSLELLLQYHRW